MMGKTHSATGTILWASVAPLLTRDPWHLLGGALICATLPYLADLDHPNSTSSRMIWGPLHKRIGPVFAKLVGGHRAGMHSLWAVLLCGAALGALATAIAIRWAPWLDVRLVALAGALGYFGGILGDMLTKQRVKFFWPLSSRKVGLPIFETNTWGEAVFNVAQASLGAGAIYWHVS